MGRLFSKRGHDGGRCGCNSPDEVDGVIVVFPRERGVSVRLVQCVIDDRMNGVEAKG